jgi:glycosyltransferase involved in cell wall biosynthesis
VGSDVRRDDAAPSLRVLVVSHASGMWGAQRQLLGLAPELAERGVRLTLAVPPGSLRWTEAWRSAGLDVLELPLPEHAGLRGEGGVGRPSLAALAREGAVVLRSARRIRRVARQYDLVLSASLSAHVETVLAARAARRSAVLMVVDLVVPGLGRRLLRAAARVADATIVNSSATESMFDGNNDVFLLHPGADIESFTPGEPNPSVRASLGATSDDELLVGIVGRLDEEKGVHVLLEAVRDLDVARPLRVVVVGDVGTGPPEYAERVRALAEPMADRVLLTGRRDDVPDVMRALDVLVNASRAEPFGLTVLEAQACGTAVVGTAAGGIPDFVEDGVTGLLVPPDDVEALRDALRRILGDENLRAQLAHAGRRQATERFDVRLQFDRYASLFHRLAR